MTPLIRRPSAPATGGRGQLSMDFLITIVVALVIFLFLMQAFETRQAGVREAQNRLDATHTAELVADSANAVLLAGSGAGALVALPSALQSNEPYTANVTVNATGPDVARIDVAWSNGFVSRPLLTTRASGNLTPGGTVNITNTNGSLTFA